MKAYFAYIRVSTVKQGEHGSSLSEQRDAIVAFAARQGLTISAWFEERETAAKSGRGEFLRMLTALKKGKASGVIFHKIDRSARNLKDWSTIQDLAERGIDVRFTQESIDLGSNEGKLTGDFLAVIASHYIRNLREEVKKGIRGRLKQGIYPLQAPLGYVDQGSGKAKTPDPACSPFVRAAFELYASGNYDLRHLSEELYRRGLRSKSGRKVYPSTLSVVLRNPFYIGIIHMRGSGQTYPGIHQPLIEADLFKRVQSVLDGNWNGKIAVHNFLFRRMIVCAQCRRRLTGERQRGHVYYRCHTTTCPRFTVREETVESVVATAIRPICFRQAEIDELRSMIGTMGEEMAKTRGEQTTALKLKLAEVSGRLSRLTDVLIDGMLDRGAYEAKRLELLTEERRIKDAIGRVSTGDEIERTTSDFFEHLKCLSLSLKMATIDEKRDLLKIVTSNIVADGKDIVVELHSPFREVREVNSVLTSPPLRNRPRTLLLSIAKQLYTYFTAQVEGRQRDDYRDVLAA
jgi:site-specific DNA recombinase